ncbi:sterile alpha motif domain-containing protein 12-like [Anneissia japonica]|uniref:sterile alpha motif domain-containing protein 12-like n=1 Tax=Anneissia japonica TaxID=1529436 RepID=UPI00142559FC|nr:sterile alpha motif domain-containing protein 12-like [Anneissia japonica]
MTESRISLREKAYILERRCESVPNGGIHDVDRYNRPVLLQQAKSLKKSARSRKSVFKWDNSDVLRWLRKHHLQYYQLYGTNFKEHDISGRALIKLNLIKLEKMEISDPTHRTDLLEYILRLRLKHEQTELRLLSSNVM